MPSGDGAGMGAGHGRGWMKGVPLGQRGRAHRPLLPWIAHRTGGSELSYYHFAADTRDNNNNITWESCDIPAASYWGGWVP